MNIDIIPLCSFVLVATFTPGPNNISCASMGILYGYKKTLGYLIGIASGFFLIMVACAYLSSALLAIMPSFERYLRIVGAAYILWLAAGILRCNFSIPASGNSSGSFVKGLVLQLFNPKVVIYGLTLYSTFMAPLSGNLDYLWLSAMVFASLAFVSISTWTLFGAVIKSKLKNDRLRKMVNVFLSLLLIYTAADISGVLT